MTGMMHFVKSGETHTSQTLRADAIIKLTKRIAAIGSVSGNTNIASQFAASFPDTMSSTGMDNVFDLIVQGFMSKLQSITVTDVIKQFFIICTR